MLFSDKMLNTSKKANKLILKALILFLISGFGVFQGTALAANALIAYGSDTTAGSPTFLRVKSLEPNQQVNFVVEKPDGMVLTLTTLAGQDGEASTELYDYHTQKAGNYVVSAVLPNQINSNTQAIKTSFKVLAGDVDIYKSKLSVDRSLVKADGKDFVTVSAKLTDVYNNPIFNRSLKLIPSRSTDVVQKDMLLTDVNGEAFFRISSSVAGIGAFSAMDMTDGALLTSRVNMSFVAENDFIASAGGDFLKVANAATAGPLASFDISGFPANIKPNDNVTFKVKAVDATDLTVEDYTGTIRFSAEGDNANGVTLPANYKFLAEDLGEHSFNLGISFNKAGTYKVSVNDLSDKFKTGSVTVVVSDSGVNGGDSVANKPIISSPTAGTYSQSQQTISGTAKQSSTISIYDNSQLLSSVPVGPTGKYSFQTGNLADGEHSIYVVNIDTITLEVISNSDPVVINIDTTPPKLDQLLLDPSTGINGGDTIKIKVYSEANLSQAAVTFNFDIVPLTASIADASVYEGTIQAPKDPGSYSLNVLLVDELHNEGNYQDQAKILVDANGGTVENNANSPVNTDSNNSTPVDGNAKPIDIAGSPSQVSGLIAYGSDKKITLVWDAAKDDKQVQKYMIYYGQDVKNLSQNVHTKDASTTWFIPNLENGKEYFFAVAAMDSDGNESVNKSEIVSAIPFMLEVKKAVDNPPTESIASADLHPAAYDGPFPTQTPKNGPEIGFIFLGSAGISALLKFRKKK